MDWNCFSLKKILVFLIVYIMLCTPFFSSHFFVSADLFSFTQQQNQNGNRIFVDLTNDNGPWTGSVNNPFKKISNALDNASAYDRIFVNEGVYNESLTICFPVYLIGVSSPVIDGGYNQNVISIHSANVSIEDFILVHSDGDKDNAGIYTSNAKNITISNCIIHHTKTGIFLNDTDDVFINTSWFFHSGNAIQTNHASNISIHSCDFARNSIVLLIQYSDQISMYNSTFTANGLTSFIYLSEDIIVEKCNISDNSVNKGGMFFSDSNQIVIKNTLFRHNGAGISLSNVTSTIINQCDFVKNTHFAISLRKPSRQILISNCTIKDNLRNGVYIEAGNTVSLVHSNLVNNYGYSILAKNNAQCHAIKNWWNSKVGPWLSFFTKTNKISFFQGEINVNPWSDKPCFQSGLHTNVPSPRYNHTFDERIHIVCDTVDSDGDGASDEWEERYGYDPLVQQDHVHLDPDNDGLSNVQECYTDSYGSHPFYKDIFLELDWMKCENNETNKPDESWLQPLIDSYAKHNITLHIDLGSLGGGEEITYHCKHTSTYAALENMYWTFFLENDMQNPRKNIFHYGLLCNYCPDLNFPFIGWNSFDSFAVSVEWLSEEYPQYDRQQLIVGAIAHHLGHTLGLTADTYQGIDNMETLQIFGSEWRKFRHYRSCMNYFYKYRLFTFSDGSNNSGDFDDWAHLDFDFFQHAPFEE